MQSDDAGTIKTFRHQKNNLNCFKLPDGLIKLFLPFENGVNNLEICPKNCKTYSGPEFNTIGY